MDKKSWIIILALSLLIILGVCGTIIGIMANKIDRLEHNIVAYKDKIEYVELKNGEILAEKSSLILTESEMREQLNMSKSEVKDLKKKLADDIAQIARLEAKLSRPDTLFMKPDTVYINNDFTSKKFTWTDDWTTIHATVSGIDIASSNLSIDKFRVDLPVDVGLTDAYNFWIKSPNPNITFTNINSVVINNSSVKQKKKRFHHGLHIGIGVQYGLIDQKFDVGPSFNYGFTFSF